MSIVGSPEKQSRMPFLIKTESTKAQEETELECQPYFEDLHQLPSSQLDDLRQIGLIRDGTLDICLLLDKHIEYLQQVWSEPLKASFVSLDASRTWMIYWTLHACDLLNHQPDDQACQNIVHTLSACWMQVDVHLPVSKFRDDPILSAGMQTSDAVVTIQGGGFGGGPGQMPHAATTYAAVLALCILAASSKDTVHSKSALELLETIRRPLYAWMLSVQEDDGSFRMHHDGEIDVRATYCVIVVAKLLGICTKNVGGQKTIDSIARCQTYEGGFGGEPWSEAHGGYTFCASAALQLLKGFDSIDVATLTGWLAARQMSYEGGFNGRANKLVDGCYSFWQGGAMAILSILQSGSCVSGDTWLDGKYQDTPLLFDEGMLERYILLCAQNIHGGLRDKPSKRRDFYHSCYNLSGLSIAQHYSGEEAPAFGHARLSRVERTHPCYNIRVEYARHILNHFSQLGYPENA